MSGKHVAPVVFIAVIAGLLFAVAGCTHTGVSGAGSAVARSSAVAKAESQADACLHKTGTTALLTASGRATFVSCLETMVAPAKQQAFKNCVTHAATSDKLWTTAGRLEFTTQSLENCVNAAA
jgi:hypothetical protein